MTISIASRCTGKPTAVASMLSVVLALFCLPPTSTAAERASTDQSGEPTELNLPNSAEPVTTTMPQLGNTAQSDRMLLREIGDHHIYQPENELAPSNQSASPSKKIQARSAAKTAWEYVLQSSRLEIPDRELVSFYREQYRRDAKWVSNMLNRATPFIGHVVDELDRRYLPLELALLPAIESGYRPNALSSKNAAGVWQIIPATATDVGITHTPWFDGRSDIIESTTAATDYLGYLNAEFHGDWLLTLAAYNGGIGRIRNAVKRNRQAGLPTDFWSLRLSRETSHYVPKFLALLAMLRHDTPDDLVIPTVQRGTAFDIVDVRQRVRLERLAQLTGITRAQLRHLNAGLVQGITPPNGPHRVYVPQGVGSLLIEQLTNNKNRVANADDADNHLVVAGDNISSIAQRYRISGQRLKQLNNLKSDTIFIGQTLVVADVETASQRVEYVVSLGDTLSDIAQRFSTQVDDIRDEHGQKLTDDVIYPGKRLSLVAPSGTSDLQ